MERAFLVHALVGVRAEIVALGLRQVLGQAFAAIRINVTEGRGKAQDRDAGANGLADDGPQGGCLLVHNRRKEAVHEEIHEVRLPAIGRGDRVEKFGTDDAAAFPNPRDLGELQAIVVFLRRLTHQGEALRVATDDGDIKGVAQGLQDRRLVGRGLGRRPFQNPGRRDALLLEGREDAALDGHVDRRNGDAQVHRVLAGPLAGAFLAGLVEDEVHEGLAGVGIFRREVDDGDLHQVAAQFGGVPLGDSLAHLVGLHAEDRPHDVVHLGNALHDAVLDAVVDHFDVVSGAARADVGAAGAVHLGGARFEDLADQGVGLFGAARHDRGTLQRACFAAGDARADIKDALLCKFLNPSLSVRKE